MAMITVTPERNARSTAKPLKALLMHHLKKDTSIIIIYNNNIAFYSDLLVQ